jgi:hypothetical protein
VTDDAGTPTDIDWDEAMCRERRLDGLLVLFALVMVAGYLLLRGVSFSAADRVGLLIGGGVLFTLFVVSILGLIGRDGRRNWSDELRLRHAIRAHVDPGPEWQDRADAYAERAVHGSLLWWLYLLLGIAQVLAGREERPAVVAVGGVLLLGGLVGVLLWQRSLAIAGRRWLDDPPGREPLAPYAPPPDQRPWTISARQGIVLALLVIATVAALVGAIHAFG